MLTWEEIKEGELYTCVLSFGIWSEISVEYFPDENATNEENIDKLYEVNLYICTLQDRICHISLPVVNDDADSVHTDAIKTCQNYLESIKICLIKH